MAVDGLMTGITTPHWRADHDQSGRHIPKMFKHVAVLTSQLKELEHHLAEPQYLELGDDRTIDLDPHPPIKRRPLGTVLLHHPMIQKDVECGHSCKDNTRVSKPPDRLNFIVRNDKIQFSVEVKINDGFHWDISAIVALASRP